jgi:hypothetical protein
MVHALCVTKVVHAMDGFYQWLAEFALLFVEMESLKELNNAMMVIQFQTTVVHRRVLFNIAEMELFKYHKSAMMETL